MKETCRVHDAIGRIVSVLESPEGAMYQRRTKTGYTFQQPFSLLTSCPSYACGPEDSIHLAPYRRCKPKERAVIWLDLDHIGPEHRDLPLWPSRVDFGRGVAIFPVKLGPCDYRCVYRCYAKEFGGDPSAAKAGHSFRLPGSPCKDGPAPDVIDDFLLRWDRGWWPAPEEVHNPYTNVRGTTQGGFEEIPKATFLLVKELWVTGNRHEVAVAFAGILRKSGLTEKAAVATMRSMCVEMGDGDVSDRVAAVRTTYQKSLDEVAGYSILKGLK